MSDWRPEDVQPGDVLIATDAVGDVHEVRALTGMWWSEFREISPGGRARWVPGAVITVGFSTKDDEGRNWPVESLRPRGASR